ncbi:MAG: ribbon-helix-helix protein, CopG family [Gemmatimonadaceae bacterium]
MAANPTAITIRLDRELARRLAKLSRRLGRSRSDIVRDALRRQLVLLQFEELRARVAPFAEAQGYLTDEDVARDVS